MAEVSLQGLENMFREGTVEGVNSAGCLTADYSTVTKEEAEEIATALKVYRNLQIKWGQTQRGIDKITEDMKNAYGLTPERADWLKNYARDLQVLNDVQRGT